MRKYWKPLVAFNLALVLSIVVWQVWLKEQILREGKLVLLNLAPKDPLSLMQGYYMTLRYDIARELSYSEIPARGYMVVSLDSQRVARLVRTQSEPTPLSSSELLIKYFYNDAFVSIGAESYFFEEGQDTTFANARYGALRVNDKGESVLIGLYNQERQLIEPK